MSYKWILRNLDNNAVFQLKKDPKGWKDLALHLYRSDQYRGIFREPTSKKLTFLSDGGGKEFIESVIAQYDINGNILLTCLSDSGTGNFKPLFTGKLNLSNREDIDGDSLTLIVEQSDLFSKILARQKTSINPESAVSVGGKPITPVALKNITLPGMNIFMRSEWRGEYASPSHTASASVNYGGILQPVTTLFRDDLKESNELNYHYLIDTPAIPFEASGIKPIFTFQKSDIIADNSAFYYNYKYRGNFSCILSGAAGEDYLIEGTLSKKIAYGQSIDEASVSTLFSYSFGPSDGASVWIDQTDTSALVLNYDDKVWSFWELTFKVTGSAFAALATFNLGFDEQFFQLEIDTAYNPSTAKSIMVHEAFQSVVDSITDSDGNFESSFYGRTDSDKVTYPVNGKGAFKCFTNGLNVRMQESPLLFNLQDLFEAADAIDNIGLGILDGKVVVGPIADFFNRNKRILTIPNVKSIKTNVEEQYYYNRVSIGFEKWETEYKNGLEDPVTKADYSTFINSLSNDYTRISKFLASPFVIEVTRRRNLVQHSTEDWRYDNSNIWLCLNDDYTLELLADAFAAVSGMTDKSTAPNLRLTPERLLTAHFANIVAGLQTINGKVSFISKAGNNNFTSTKTNTGQQSDYNGQPLSSTSSFDWNDANILNIKPLWLPLSDSIECPLNPDEYAAIEADPYGYIEFFKVPTDIRRGYILDMSYKMRDGLTQFKLLRRYGN